MSQIYRRLGGAVLLAALALFPRLSLAYEEVTHGALTQEIVDFYNLIHPEDPITREEREWIIQGSIDEDQDPRWLNHFYDPVYKTGWSGEGAGNLSPSVAQAISKAGLSTADPLPSPDWAINYEAQQKFSVYGGNHSWRASLGRYAEGNKKAAYVSLGHALHLVEDAGVPDHTRNDSHGHVAGDRGSPFESYAERWNRVTLDGLMIPESLQKNGLGAKKFDSIDGAIRSLASYSNKHFFSKDTINDPKYSDPKIVREDENYGYGLDEFERNHPLVRVRWNRSEGKVYSLDIEDIDILNSYFTHLSRQIVLHGAGVIKLFKDEARDAEVNKEFPEHIVGIRQGFLDALHIPTFSLFAAANNVKAYFSSQFATVAEVLEDWFGGEEITEEIDYAATIADLAAQIELESRFEASGGRYLPEAEPFEPAPLVIEVKSDSPQPTSTLAATTTLYSPAPIAPQNLSLPGGDGSRKSASSSIGTGDTAGSSADSSSSTPFSTPSINNLEARFISSLMKIELTWDAASSSIYRIYDFSSALLFESSSTLVYATSVLEMAKEYSFVFELEDASGIASTSISVTPPSPFTSMYFYPDARYISSEKYVLDFTHGPVPFMPVAHSGAVYQGIVFYLNRAPDAAVTNLLSSDNFIPTSTEGVLGLYYGGCGTVLSPRSVLHIAYNSADCGAGAGLRSKSIVFPMEDNRFILPTNIDLFSPLLSSSYVTAAFYNAGPDGMVLVATDPTPHYLMADMPESLPPETPQEITIALDDSNLKLNVNWASSTDPDSSDSVVRYEFSYATSSSASSTWISRGFNLDASVPLEYPNTYFLGLRAVDEFGSASEPIFRTWNFPENYPTEPAQLLHTAILGPASGGGSGQRFRISATTTIDGVHAWLGPSGAVTMALICIAVTCNEANGEVIATSTITGLPPDTESGQVIYTFPETTLSPGDYYLSPVSFNQFKNFVYGAAGNPYPDGEWSGDSDEDMFFRLRTVPSSYTTYITH